MPELTPFQLWSQGAWPTREVVGEAYRRDSIRTLFPSRRLSGGHDLDKTARLVPEPRNPHDANAVAVVVDNVLVGYLARDEAAKYQRVLLDLNRAGLDATVPCTIHGYEYEETDYDRRGRPVTSITFQAQARIVLDEWYRCRPVNAAPANHALLPVGAALQVQKEEDHQDVLRRYLNANGECWAYATLHVIEGGSAKAPRELVELRIDGSRVGQLTPASSAHYVPTIEAAANAITCPVLFLMQLEDELFNREQYLALFDALATTDKRLHANPGLHPQVPVEELHHSIDFLLRHLRGEATDFSPTFTVSN